MTASFEKQFELLLNVLPEVSKEKCFAMHGGTAINLFVRNMPRISVDIDLTYIEIDERKKSLDKINAALLRIKERIEALRNSIRVEHKENICKLYVYEGGEIIKIEANMVGRGLLGEPSIELLCEATQEQFDVYFSMQIVSLAQLYGSKLCAALDRQHPRDLFDVKVLFENEGFSNSIKQGFILGLAISGRPINELLDPNLLDQRKSFEDQFAGMNKIEFSYHDFEETRIELIKTVNTGLSEDDKKFLLNLHRFTPDWSIHDFQNFPAIKWRLYNLDKYKTENPKGYEEYLGKLETVLKYSL